MKRLGRRDDDVVSGIVARAGRVYIGVRCRSQFWADEQLLFFHDDQVFDRITRSTASAKLGIHV